MTSYRRNRIAGGNLFLHDSNFRAQNYFGFGICPGLSAGGLADYTRKAPLRIGGIVLFTDHLHCMWTLPHEDSNYPIRWAMIKVLFTKCYLQGNEVIQPSSNSRLKKGKASVWQRRYWEHTIRDEQDYNRHVDYIHYNPVKHGLVTAPIDWQYSTLRNLSQTVPIR